MSEEPRRPPAQLAIVRGGRVALVGREDGRLGLPEVPGWDGDAWAYRKALNALDGQVPAPLRARVTHLTPLHFGQGGTAPVGLAEARGAIEADAWWAPGDPGPAEMPEPAASGLRAALTRRYTGSPWPAFCVPGATDMLRATVAHDSDLSARAAISLDGAPEDPREMTQEQGWSLSSVWRNEELVLKLTNPAWHGEAAITRLLAQVSPSHVPEVLSAGFVPADPAKGPYLVQRRVVEPPEPVDLQERHARSVGALVALAQVQVVSAGREDELLVAGAADRRPARTAAELEWVWRAVSPELSEEDRAKLPTLDALAREALKRLERSPAVLVHGDLHLGNVLQDDAGAPQLIDWTDAALAWPGADAYLLVQRFHEMEDEREQVVGAYVEALGPEHEQGVRLGLEVAPLYHALSYLRIREFLPRELVGPFGGEVPRLLKRQLEVFGL